MWGRPRRFELPLALPQSAVLATTLRPPWNIVILVGAPRFELGLNAPKAFVLPLHNAPMLIYYLKNFLLSKAKFHDNIQSTAGPL